MFLLLINPGAEDTMLDVGGYRSFWTSRAQDVKRIDIVNKDEAPWDNAPAPNHNIRFLVCDGCSLPMADKTYDIGFSNSVIEHVGSWERQQQFASEIRRVAKTLWVQTPAYECPIEPHYLTPFVHYFPHSFQKKVLRWCTVYGLLEHPTLEHIVDMVDSTRLLRKSEMRELFPDCELITERILGILPKSYIAVRKVNMEEDTQVRN